MATHVRPSLAPALVAPQLLGLLARPMATFLCKLPHAEGLAGAAETRAEGPQVEQRSSVAKTHAEGHAGTAKTRAEGPQVEQRAAVHGNACQAFTGTCTMGTAATGASGTFDGVCVCASCNAGFTLNGNPCQAITCTCTSGTAATGGFWHVR